MATITNIRTFEDGDKRFDLVIPAEGGGEVVIYGCKVVTAKNGHKFVSFPARKGKDGKYYRHAYYDMPADTVDKIIECVENY